MRIFGWLYICYLSLVLDLDKVITFFRSFLKHLNAFCGWVAAWYSNQLLNAETALIDRKFKKNLRKKIKAHRKNVLAEKYYSNKKCW